MSKYDEYLELKKVTEKLIKDFINQLDVPKVRDKTDLRWRFETLGHDGHWGRLNLSTGMSHGSYGCSSASNDTSEEAGKELAITLTNLREIIVKTTVERLKKQLNEAALKAKTEAEEVLSHLEEV